MRRRERKKGIGIMVNWLGLEIVSRDLRSTKSSRSGRFSNPFLNESVTLCLSSSICLACNALPNQISVIIQPSTSLSSDHPIRPQVIPENYDEKEYTRTEQHSYPIEYVCPLTLSDQASVVNVFPTSFV